jgi:hypothetical protein
MSDCCYDPTDTFWSDRLAAAKASVISYEAAIEAVKGGAQSYRLNTSQTDQSVTKASLATLQTGLDSALNRVATLEARLCGSGVTHVVPGW